MPLVVIGESTAAYSYSTLNYPEQLEICNSSKVAQKQYHGSPKLSRLVDIWKLKAYTGSRFVQYLLHFIRSIHSYIV